MICTVVSPEVGQTVARRVYAYAFGVGAAFVLAAWIAKDTIRTKPWQRGGES